MQQVQRSSVEDMALDHLAPSPYDDTFLATLAQHYQGLFQQKPVLNTVSTLFHEAHELLPEQCEQAEAELDLFRLAGLSRQCQMGHC